MHSNGLFFVFIRKCFDCLKRSEVSVTFLLLLLFKKLSSAARLCCQIKKNGDLTSLFFGSAVQAFLRSGYIFIFFDMFQLVLFLIFIRLGLSFLLVVN